MTTKLFALCLVSLLTTATLADDEVHPFISSKYSIQLGGYFPSKDFKLSVDGSIAGTDQEFDFEKATGLRSDDEVFMLEFKWRFGEKWSARLQYYEADQSKTAVLEQDITWRDQGILAGSSVDEMMQPNSEPHGRQRHNGASLWAVPLAILQCRRSRVQPPMNAVTSA